MSALRDASEEGCQLFTVGREGRTSEISRARDDATTRYDGFREEERTGRDVHQDVRDLVRRPRGSLRVHEHPPHGRLHERERDVRPRERRGRHVLRFVRRPVEVLRGFALGRRGLEDGPSARGCHVRARERELRRSRVRGRGGIWVVERGASETLFQKSKARNLATRPPAPRQVEQVTSTRCQRAAVPPFRVFQRKQPGTFWASRPPRTSAAARHDRTPFADAVAARVRRGRRRRRHPPRDRQGRRGRERIARTGARDETRRDEIVPRLARPFRQRSIVRLAPAASFFPADLPRVLPPNPQTIASRRIDRR